MYICQMITSEARLLPHIDYGIESEWIWCIALVLSIPVHVWAVLFGKAWKNIRHILLLNIKIMRRFWMRFFLDSILKINEFRNSFYHHRINWQMTESFIISNRNQMKYSKHSNDVFGAPWLFTSIILITYTSNAIFHMSASVFDHVYL